MKKKAILQKFYHRLFAAFGPQHWWPAKTRFEVAVGAILTQNTNWGNVEKALARLRKKKCLSAQALHRLPVTQIALLIQPAGYFNVKARRIKNFVDVLFNRYNGQIARMKKVPLEPLRLELLSINGIGPETADSILLYALDKPIFVVDAYTKRIFARQGLLEGDEDYATVQNIFMMCLPTEVDLFNEYHALIVRLGKDFCAPRPRCSMCLVRDICPFSGTLSGGLGLDARRNK